MQASDIMTRPVVTVQPATALREAVHLLIEHGFATLPVVDEDMRLLGVITEADVLGSSLVEGGVDQPVSTAMTAPVEVATPRSTAAEIVRRMLAGRLRSMPIVQDGELVGVVSRRDLLRPLVRRDDATAAGVRALLVEYTGHRNRWQVSSLGGVVTITGNFADEAERGALTALAKSVPGVTSVELQERQAPEFAR